MYSSIHLSIDCIWFAFAFVFPFRRCIIVCVASCEFSVVFSIVVLHFLRFYDWKSLPSLMAKRIANVRASPFHFVAHCCGVSAWTTFSFSFHFHWIVAHGNRSAFGFIRHISRNKTRNLTNDKRERTYSKKKLQTAAKILSIRVASRACSNLKIFFHI